MSLKSKVCVGIDFGTTYSSIGVIKSLADKVMMITYEDEKYFPSCIFFGPGECLFGSPAKDKGHPQNIIYDNKRFIGRKWNEIQQHVQNYPFIIDSPNDTDVRYTISIPDKTTYYTPIDIATLQLTIIKNILESELKPYDIQPNIIITVPSYFNSQQKHATLKAGIV